MYGRQSNESAAKSRHGQRNDSGRPLQRVNNSSNSYYSLDKTTHTGPFTIDTATVVGWVKQIGNYRSRRESLRFSPFRLVLSCLRALVGPWFGKGVVGAVISRCRRDSKQLLQNSVSRLQHLVASRRRRRLCHR